MFVTGRNHACMPIDREKYTIQGCIPTYFPWWPDKTDFTIKNIKFLCGMTNIGGGKVIDTIKI
jgi:hypothetical protein